MLCQNFYAPPARDTSEWMIAEWNLIRFISSPNAMDFLINPLLIGTKVQSSNACAFCYDLDMNVLVIGSVNIDTTIYVDRFPGPGETLIARSLEVDVGGKGLNQAVACSRAGANATFLTVVGSDEHAEMVKAALGKEKLSSFLIKKANVPTGTAYIIVNVKGENEIVIDKGSNGAFSISDIDDHIDLIKNSGIIVLQNEIPVEVDERIMELAHKLGKIIIYNPAPFVPVDENCYKFVDYCIPNETELGLAVPSEKSLEDKCRYLLNKGVKNVIVTLGEKGSFCFNGKENGFIKATAVKAVDTVAAGDTYIGYFAQAIATGKPVKEAMELASKAAAIAVSRKGALISVPFSEELN